MVISMILGQSLLDLNTSYHPIEHHGPVEETQGKRARPGEPVQAVYTTAEQAVANNV